MSRSFSSNGFSSSGFGGSRGGGIDGIWEAMEEFRSRFEKKVGTRVGRGDVRAAVLTLLAERPMHGYQIIQEIEERSNGSWKPSAGSVYPTLQLLADEGLVSADESNGRKTYALTEAGLVVAASSASNSPFATDSADDSDDSGRRGRGALPKAGFELAQIAAQVGRTGTPEQVEQAVAELEGARRRLYAILAQD
ncbi:PadR family transcriptional regulator [Cnuibacter sp. UC19_7]|uniref:PadR family transcriptional regulator n=1 Tax=Cnuibacter sp. UC19_7 TaxID=3350166 RepID=UPI00366BB181